MSSPAQPYRGVFPVAPTVFDASGALDLDGQRRAIDFMIDAGSHGICILANFSEQFVLSDEERERLTPLILDHVAGRVPVTRPCSFCSRTTSTRGLMPHARPTLTMIDAALSFAAPG